MPERISITVRSKRDGSDILSVQDAMSQVLDFFNLLARDQDDDAPVLWNLINATTNSPFTAEAEAVSTDDVDAGVVARAQKKRFARNLETLAEGALPPDWSDTEARETVTRLLRRSQNGIGETVIDYRDGTEPIAISTEMAVLISTEIEMPRAIYQSSSEYGSIEGRLIEVGTYYDEPAIRIKDRRTGVVIWCRVPTEIREKLAEQYDFNDVWEHRRFIVHGRIQYSQEGKLQSVSADRVEPVPITETTIDDLRDEDFTGGLTAPEYLDKLRDGDLDH